MNIRLIAITLMTCCAGWSNLFAQSNPADAKAKLAKWVETRQIISKETSDWKLDQEFLTSTRDLLQSQREALEAEIAKLKEETSKGEEERQNLNDEKTSLQLANAALGEEIAKMEADIRKIIKLFPDPLKQKLEPLIRQIPADPEKTELALGKRLTNVLGILGQAEKFNGTANVFGETRVINGKELTVNTIYWGLSFAMFVDGNGQIAGFGSPGPEGWSWTEDNSIAPSAKLFIDMYEGNTDAIEFVALPVTIQ